MLNLFIFDSTLRKPVLLCLSLFILDIVNHGNKVTWNHIYTKEINPHLFSFSFLLFLYHASYWVCEIDYPSKAYAFILDSSYLAAHILILAGQFRGNRCIIHQFQNLNEHIQDCLSDLCVPNKVTVTLSKDNDVKGPWGASAVCVSSGTLQEMALPAWTGQGQSNAWLQPSDTMNAGQHILPTLNWCVKRCLVGYRLLEEHTL